MAPEVVLVLRSGESVFAGGRLWWWQDRARTFAKGPLEVTGAELGSLAVPTASSSTHFRRPWLAAGGIALAGLAWCSLTVAIGSLTTTIDVVGALPFALVVATAAGVAGYAAFRMLRSSRPYVPARQAPQAAWPAAGGAGERRA